MSQDDLDDSPRSAMLMTAGLGTRLQPFTYSRTKAVLPVLGIPSAQYALDSLVASGVTRIVANVHHLAADTTQRLRELDCNGAQLQIKDESQLLLGTAGGLLNALGQLGSNPFFRANADVICDLDWMALYQRHLELKRDHGVLMTLAIFPQSPNRLPYPEILVDREGQIMTGIGSPQASRPFWTGAAVIEPEALKGVPQKGPSEFVPDVLLPAVRSEQVGVCWVEGVWHDIGSPALWAQTHFDLMRLFESDGVKNPRVQRWQERFLRVNRCIADHCWEHRSSQIDWAGSGVALQGPFYIGDGADGSLVRKVGPQAVVYGPMPQGLLKCENGIAFGGYWVKK